MSYHSNWNEKNELRCLLIFKQLKADNFPKKKQISYCREMEKITKLTADNISAKVSNYKSVAKINNNSNASKNTIRIYDQYKNLSIQELEKMINEL